MQEYTGDAGHEAICQFIKDQGYKTEITIDITRMPSIQVNGGISERGCTIAIKDGHLAIFYVKLQNLKMQPDSIPEASLELASTKIRLHEPDSLDILAKKLKGLFEGDLSDDRALLPA